MGQLPLDNVHPDELLSRALEAGCSELHLLIGQSPRIRSYEVRSLDALPEYQALTHLDVQQMMYALLADEQIRQLEREGEIDFSYSLMRTADFDVHVIYSKDNAEAHFTAKPTVSNA